MLSYEFLDILACPACKGTLAKPEDGNSFLCIPCNLKYPVINGIPVMLVNEAIKIQDQESRDKVC
jgi:uncharacterized protein YbaR (Trm112 family)